MDTPFFGLVLLAGVILALPFVFGGLALLIDLASDRGRPGEHD